LDIPISRLQIERAESNEVLFTDPEQTDSWATTFDERILTHRVLVQNTGTRLQMRGMRQQADTRWRLKATVLAVAIIIGLIIFVPIVLGFMVRVLVARVPPSYEQKMGADAMAEIRSEETFLTNAVLQAKLESAVTPLTNSLPAAPTRYQFFILDDPEANAFALPGGYVLVTRGLLSLVDRPEQLAGAVAHEVAHVTQKHAIRHAIASFGPMMLLELFASGNNALGGSVGAASQVLVIQSFSQEYELEADAVGWKYLLDAHIDPHGMIELLQKFQAEEDKMNFGPELNAFNSHPGTKKRIARLESKWKKVKTKSGFMEFEKWEAPKKQKETAQ